MRSRSYRRAGRAVATAVVGVLATATATAVRVSTITLTPARDATLYEDAGGDRANGAGQHLFIGRTNQAERRRALFRFDIAGNVPGGAIVTGVTLTLNLSKTASGSRTASLHRVLADWGEGVADASGQEGSGAAAEAGDATWIHSFFDTAAWDLPGGDYAVSPSASRDVAGTGSYAWSSAAMAADVQAWLDEPSTNSGWVLLGDETVDGTAKRFDSREHPTAAFRPQLTVTMAIVVAPGPTYASGWHIVSLPVTPTDGSFNALFSDAISAFAFDGSYQQVTELVPCQGYWVNLATGGTYEYTGNAVAQCDQAWTAGWSLVGVPWGGAAVGDIAQDPADNLISVFSFDGAYHQVDLGSGTLNTGEGYWFNLTAPGRLVLHAPSP